MNTTEINAVNVQSGTVQKVFTLNEKLDNLSEDEIEADVIYSFAVSSDFLITAHRSGLLRLWSLETAKVVKLWKSQHKGPVVKVVFSKYGELVCSSGADGHLRIWDYSQSHCLTVLKECPGPALIVEFHAKNKEIYAAGVDNTVYCWNFEKKELVNTFKGHISQITAFAFFYKNSHQLLATVSRDKVLIVWQIAKNEEPIKLKVIFALCGMYVTNIL